MNAVAQDFGVMFSPSDDSSSASSPPVTPLRERFSSGLQAAIARAKRAAIRPVRLLTAVETIEEAPLFRTARQAVRLVVALEGKPVRPLSSQMVDLVSGRRDLAGYDLAAMAGVIQSILRALGPVQYALLVAEVVEHKLQCSCRSDCCSGFKRNRLWLNVLNTITQEGIGKLPPRSKRDYALVWALLMRIFGGSDKKTATFADLATEFAIDCETVSRQYNILRRWLHGAKANKHGPAVEGAISSAWSEAETALRQAGIVG